MLHDLIDSLEAGQSLKLPSLAATLDLIASKGPDGRYLPFLKAAGGSSWCIFSAYAIGILLH